MRVRREQHNYLVYNFEKARITLSKILISSNINHKTLNAKSFGYVTGLKYSSFNAIKVFKTSQRNGKDNAKIKYCRWAAGRILMTRSVLNYIKIEE